MREDGTAELSWGMRHRNGLLVWAALLGLAWLGWAGHGVDQRNTNWLTGLVPQPGLVWIYLAAAFLFALLSYLAWALIAFQGAERWPQWASGAFILLVAIAARLAVCQTWIPTLSDDIFRYRHDGHLLLERTQPYSYFASDVGTEAAPWYQTRYVKKSPHQYDLLDRMSNNVQVPTIYLPVSLAVFAGAAWVENREFGPGRFHPEEFPQLRNTPEGHAQLLELSGNPRLMPYRAAHVAADVGIIVVLMIALANLGKSVWWAALYAWHPLPIIEIAGNGHLESVGVLLFVCTVLAGIRRKWIWAAVLAGLTLMAKQMGLFLAPALIIWFWRSDPRGWRVKSKQLGWMAAAYLATVAACLAPFAKGLPDLWKSMQIFAHHWEFNGFFFTTIRWLSFHGDTTYVRPIMNRVFILTLISVLAVAYWRRWLLERLAGHVMILFLIFTAQVYPWYVLWPLAMVPLCWNRASWVFSFTVLFSYGVWIIFQATGEWALPGWVFYVEWVPVVVLELNQLVMDGWKAPESAARISGEC